MRDGVEPLPGDGDRRDIRRYRATAPPPARLLARPEFHAAPVRITDLSAHGIGVLHEVGLAVGTRVAIEWHFGPPGGWRTVLARIRFARPLPSLLWHLGCELETPFEEAFLEALLQVAHGGGAPETRNRPGAVPRGGDV